MSESRHRYEARVEWQGPEPAAFLKRQYSRAHHWHFDGGLAVPASSSPQIVRLPWSDAEAVDPEEAFVAAIASCHMLFFLDFAARAGFAVARYDDPAYGEMGKGADGRVQMLGVTLQPQLASSGPRGLLSGQQRALPGNARPRLAAHSQGLMGLA